MERGRGELGAGLLELVEIFLEDFFFIHDEVFEMGDGLGSHWGRDREGRGGRHVKVGPGRGETLRAGVCFSLGWDLAGGGVCSVEHQLVFAQGVPPWITGNVMHFVGGSVQTARGGRQSAMRLQEKASLVEEGVSCVEVGGVGDPGEVGVEEEGGELREAGELADGEEDEDPEEDDYEECGDDELSAEEDGSPGEVKEHLDDEKDGRFRFSESLRVVVPHEGEAGPDHDVEDGPDGAEDGVRRGSCGLIELGIP